MEPQTQVTRLLQEWKSGEDGAFDKLVPIVYDDLRMIARSHLRKSGRGLTLDTTALAHEAWVRLVDQDAVDWNDRGHFFAVYSVVTRNIIVDLARARGAIKRGGDLQRVDLDSVQLTVDEQADLILSVNEALERLEALEPRLAQVVNCRFFAGLSEEETAGALECSARTVRRDWVKAQAMLQEILAD
jgi:RNA polymerase sigma factor (TIGR02999 family)